MIVQTDKRAFYTDDEKIISQNINFISTKAFNFMREELGFALPSKTSLLRWRPIRVVVPGINENVCKNLKDIVKNMSSIERHCMVIFDEMHIKSDLCYNKARDLIDGFEDIGGGRRTLQLGSKFLFFMIKGITSNRKYVFSYYITDGSMDAKTLNFILRDNLSNLTDIGLNVKSIVCDQAGINRSLYGSYLGIQISKPYFMHNNTKVYAFYDYCHLIKSIRNTMLFYQIETVDGIASFDVIRALYDIDKQNPNFKICPKLTEVHVYPSNFDCSNVLKAVQILSNSVAAGIDLAYNQNLFGKNEYVKSLAKSTQKFVKKCNDIFDDLDAKTLTSTNPLKCAIPRDSTKKIQRLKGYVEHLLSWKVLQIDSEGEKKYKLVHCIDGLRQTITAMLMLTEDLFETQKEIKFILPGKLNQDALENIFFSIRESQRINTTPSANEMQYIVARLISIKILKHPCKTKDGNCEDDQYNCLDWTQEDSRLETEEDDRHKLTNVSEDDKSMLALNDFNVPNESFVKSQNKVEVQVQRYYTGYCYNKVLCKLKCEKCTKSLTKTQSELPHNSGAMIKAKNYKDSSDLRLVNPTDRVFEVCHLQIKWFTQLFPLHAHRVGLKSLLVPIIQNKTETAFPGWFSDEDGCLNHRLQLLDFLITDLLFKYAKWICHEILDLS
ncbi:uncharacterized protein [Eurosta solidaginis]|uniref:uncharacterized protein n=1 Tax=Eurosta solidaginis TaxID=178769 RepID=UPI003530F000